MSKVRVKVEHAISGVKRSRIVKDILRNTKDDFSDFSLNYRHLKASDNRKKPEKETYFLSEHLPYSNEAMKRLSSRGI